MDVGLYSILIWIIAIVVGSLALVICVGSQRLSSRMFSLSLLWVTLWITQMGFFVAAKDPALALIFVRACYLFGEMIALSFLYFFFTFPEDHNPPWSLAFSLVLLQILLVYVFMFTGNIIADAFPIQGMHPWGWRFGDLSPLFELIFFGSFGTGIYILYKKYTASISNPVKKNLGYMLYAMLVGAIPPSFFCIVLPRLGSFSTDVIGPMTEVIWVPIIAYSIIRYRQMDVKAIFTEALVLAMSIIFILHIFIPDEFENLGHAISVAVFVIIAYSLIKSLIREEHQRDQLKQLNSELNEKVHEQTTEIRHSYELERRSRMDLEKMNTSKNQLITIIHHNLRTPLSIISSSIDSVVSHVSEASSQIIAELSLAKRSGERVRELADDLLSIASIKSGSSFLELSVEDIRSSIENTISVLAEHLRQMNISVRYSADQALWPKVLHDRKKIGECLFVILDNAIRYNRQNGSIDISTSSEGNNFIICIENTGLGFSSEECSRIGNSAFYRGEHAREANPIGTGVGLSVTKALIRAHHGDFKIESKGIGQGARATISLPVFGKL